MRSVWCSFYLIAQQRLNIGYHRAATTTRQIVALGGVALKAYKRYAGRMAKDMTGPELRDILAEILGQDADPAHVRLYRPGR